MKIVDVCAFYAPRGGGVRTYIDQKLAAGPALGHEIVVVAPGKADASELRGDGARIEWVASPRLPLDRRYRYFDAAETIHRALDRERPDFVEASSPWRAAAAVAAWAGGAPRALVMHSDPLAAYAYRWLEGVASVEAVDRRFDFAWRYLRDLDSRFDLVVSASDSLSGRLRAAGLRHVVTHRMGVEPGLFSPALRDPELRAQLLARCTLPPEATLLLAVGRFAPEKRWPMVVQAVMRAGISIPVGLILVGEGRERGRILREIGDNPHIQLLAPIAERTRLARLLASGDALIHGCEAETFSMATAEAAASGLALIVPDRGGAADHAAAAEGLLYAAGDAAAAAEAIAALAARTQRPGRAAGRTMLDHFRALFAHYQGIVAADRAVA
jgi:alpha-1,6-mannosyltransferase